MNPCAILVILLFKKNDSWKMCTYCRALNNITIKYKYLIPTLDDLLDELYGTSIFSKIDLRNGTIKLGFASGMNGKLPLQKWVA